MQNLQDRISYKGDLSVLLQDVCERYTLGTYLSHSLIEVGYEDFNLVLRTQNGTYFIKIFAQERSLADCERYVDIMVRVLSAGVRTPKLFPLSPNHYLYDTVYGGAPLRLVVMEYIEGKTFFDMQTAPTINELIEITRQAAKINQLEFQPSYLYDGWSIVSCVKVFEENKRHLEPLDLARIEPLIDEYKKLDVKNLPHCLVHGDLIATNVIKSQDGQLYLLDFAVANYYPRIIELAVILSGYSLDGVPKAKSMQNQEAIINTYEAIIPLAPTEKNLIPLFTNLAYAMHVMGAAGQKAKGNESEENYQWLNLGRKGLELESAN